MGHRGKIIEKYEGEILGRRFSAVMRMSRFDGRTEFFARENITGIETRDPNIDEARKKLKIELSNYYSTSDWTKHYIVRVKSALPPEREEGQERRLLTEDPVGLQFEWRPIWLGKFSNGEPCHKDREEGRPEAGLPSEIDPSEKRAHWDRDCIYSMIPATPENAAALEAVEVGLVGLGVRLKELLGQQRIQKTLGALPKMLPMLTDKSGPSKG